MMDKKELAALMRAYHAAKLAADKAKDIGEQLKAELAERGTDTVEAGGFKASVKEVSAVTLDMKALKAAHPELWEVYGKTTSTTRLYFK